MLRSVEVALCSADPQLVESNPGIAWVCRIFRLSRKDLDQFVSFPQIDALRAYVPGEITAIELGSCISWNRWKWLSIKTSRTAHFCSSDRTFIYRSDEKIKEGHLCVNVSVSLYRKNQDGSLLFKRSWFEYSLLSVEVSKFCSLHTWATLSSYWRTPGRKYAIRSFKLDTIWPTLCYKYDIHNLY